jgi:D-sedoheptulose 7-phosphate isomerase
MQSRFGDTINTINLIKSAGERLRKHVRASIDTKQLLVKECEETILAVATVVTRALGTGRKLLLCGNGGSAADCQHIAAEFVSVLTREFVRPGLPAIALTTDSSILTASANDFGFEGVFARQVQALGAAGDVVMGISTSGNSLNVLRALEYAGAHGMRTVGFTGASGGKIAAACEVCLRVPSANTQLVQESHLMVGHIVCDLAEQSLYGAE